MHPRPQQPAGAALENLQQEQDGPTDQKPRGQFDVTRLDRKLAPNLWDFNAFPTAGGDGDLRERHCAAAWLIGRKFRRIGQARRWQSDRLLARDLNRVQNRFAAGNRNSGLEQVGIFPLQRHGFLDGGGAGLSV